MQSHLIVVSAPSLAFSDRIVEAQEPVLAQALRPELAVEGLDKGAIRWLTGRLKSSVTPRVHAHRSKSREMNSLPWSTRIDLG